MRNLFHARGAESPQGTQRKNRNLKKLFIPLPESIFDRAGRLWKSLLLSCYKKHAYQFQEFLLRFLRLKWLCVS
jgi:hypothetical protein